MGIQPVVKISNLLNRINVGVAGVLLFIMMMAIVQDVILRYFFNSPSIWVTDLSRYLLCYIFFLGVSPALQSGSHVSVDLFMKFFNERGKRWLYLISHILIIIFAATYLWALTSTTMQVFTDNRVSTTAIPVPLKWIYIIGPIGMFLFFLTAIVQLITYLYNWYHPDQVEIES